MSRKFIETRYEYEKKLIKEVGKIIKDSRDIKGLTQTELSNEICNFSTLSDIENGSQKSPSIITVSKIARNLDRDFANVIEMAENKVNDDSQLQKKKILNLVALGKVAEARKLGNEYLNNENEEDIKYIFHIKGSEEFFKEEYETALKSFQNGITDFADIAKENSKIQVVNFIEIFLINDYLSTLYKIYPFDEEFFNSDILNLLFVLRNSLEYYRLFEIRLLTRIKVYLFAYFRLFGRYDMCEIIMKEVEPVIEEFGFYEIKIDLTLEKIIYFLQIGRKDLIREEKEKTRDKLQALELYVLLEYFDKAINDLEEKIKMFKSSFGENKE